jgi:hypothetical protein
VTGAATPARHTLDLIDPDTGADKPVEVEWRDALAMTVRLSRPRPYGYLLNGDQTRAAARLNALGVTVQRIEAGGELEADRYEILTMSEAAKEDVRRNDEDAQSSVVRLTTRLVHATIRVRAGDWYVPLDQPLANVIVAALEPETQSSYAANRVLDLPGKSTSPAYLPMVRVQAPLSIPAIEINAAE